ncbi:MAG: hypothetical protein AAFY26_18490 [Cyanobacteria bacterium J06638_22]
MSKERLQRIEATLAALGQTSPLLPHLPDPATNAPANAPINEAGETLHPQALLSVPITDPHAVRPFSSAAETAKASSLLEKVELPDAGVTGAPSQVSNPGLAIGILKEIEKLLLEWQRELQDLQLRIQDIQMEGPVIDGWLDSQSESTPKHPGFLQHAEMADLQSYVDAMHPSPQGSGGISERVAYRLCHLDADGNVQCQECPVDQVAPVSLAIARHQKLRQLLSRKQHLELRLGQLAETLVTVHSHLKESDRKFR